MFGELEMVLQQIKDQNETNSKTLDIIAAKLNNGVPIGESLIDSKTLRQRLGITPPTEIKMRKQKRLPFVMVGGNFRYDWAAVVNALTVKSDK